MTSEIFKNVLCGKGLTNSVAVFLSGSRYRQEVKMMVRERISQNSMILDELRIRMYIVHFFIYDYITKY